MPGVPLNATNTAVAGAADTNVTGTTSANITPTVSPLVLLVDETSNVLEMLEKTDKQIMEAGNTSASSSPGENSGIKLKVISTTTLVAMISPYPR